jgi:DNA-directed RNA polymerase specialized sigma24 family protein
MESLESLIKLLDADSDGPPGTGYQLIRLKLIRYFEWQRCIAAEELTDETIDRVARKIAEGQQIDNLKGFFYGVARLVFKEHERLLQKQLRAFATLPTSTEDVVDDNEEEKPQFACRRKCLQELPEAEHNLIVAYCKPDGRPKKERRRELAAKMGIKIGNLRLKAFRVREKLDKCTDDCMKDGGEGK